MASNEELYDEAEKLKDAGDLAGAVKKLELIVEQDANYTLAHSALAVHLGKLGRHDEAIQHAMQVCQLEPNEPFSFTALSVVCQRGGRILEAEDAKARAHMMHAQQQARP